jgi:hypothetical protein
MKMVTKRRTVPTLPSIGFSSALDDFRLLFS